MTLDLWLSLLTASLVISMTPGAGAINTMSTALAVGWRRTIFTVLGLQIALVVHIVIVAAGVGLIVARSPLLFTTIRYAGAAYLVYLGLKLILTKTDAEAQPSTETAYASESAWAMIRRGFWVNLLNPKAIVFFLAFMPQFIRPDEPQLPQYAIFAVTVVVVDIIVMWCGFALIARPFRRLTSTPRGRRILNSVFGSLFIAMAALLAVVH